MTTKRPPVEELIEKDYLSPEEHIKLGWYAIHLEAEVTRLREALELIAAPKRPDGTYNRSREACEQLAREALGAAKKEGV